MADQKNQNQNNDSSSYRSIAVNVLQNFNEEAKKFQNKVDAEPIFIYDADTSINYSAEAYWEIEKIRQVINDLGFFVELDEYIDKKNVSKEDKFRIHISDVDGCYVEFSYFEYREVMLDYMQSQSEFILSKLVKMRGNEQFTLTNELLEEYKSKYSQYDIRIGSLEDIAELICTYLDYLCHFKELHVKVFDTIGWDKYAGQRIFKYNEIYNVPKAEYLPNIIIKSSKGERSLINEDLENPYYRVPYLMKSRCNMDIADSLISEDTGADTIASTQREEWVNTLTSIMNTSPKASLIIAAACTGLIRQLLPYTKEDNINMNIVGDRASGKSTICHFALSLFGDPQILEGSFVDSTNAMELIRVQRPVIPYILDERMLKIEDQSEASKRQTILLDIFREYEGKAKERLAGQGKEYSGQRTNAPIISSSVEPMLDLLINTVRDIGQYRRFIEIKIDSRDDLFNGDSKFAEEVEALAYTQYGYGVELIVNYLMNETYNLKSKEPVDLDEYVISKYDEIKDRIGSLLAEKEKETGLVSLAASSKRFALIMTALEILSEAVKDYSDSHGTSLINEEIKQSVQDILITNLIDKMKRVAETVNPVAGFDKFIELHGDKFLANQQKDYLEGRKAGKLLLGYIEEKDKTTIYVHAGKGYEWIVFGNKDLSNEQIEDYIKQVDSLAANDKQVDKICKKVLGVSANDSIESRIALSLEHETFEIKIGTHRAGGARLFKLSFDEKQFQTKGLSDSDQEGK